MLGNVENVENVENVQNVEMLGVFVFFVFRLVLFCFEPYTQVSQAPCSANDSVQPGTNSNTQREPGAPPPPPAHHQWPQPQLPSSLDMLQPQPPQMFLMSPDTLAVRLKNPEALKIVQLVIANRTH